jgi:hypothetical protein
MILQKQKQVAVLFDHSAKPKSVSRDPKAERPIADETRQTLRTAGTPGDLIANDDSDFAEDDIWIE